MAARLRAAGYELIVHNRRREKAEPLLQAGAIVPSTNIAKEICALARQYGRGDEDYTAIFKFVSERPA